MDVQPRPWPTHAGRPPLLASLGLAGGMALLAGATDAYGLTKIGDIYVSFMSGNTTMLGVALGSGALIRAVHILPFIALFVAGAATGAVTADWSGRFQTPCVILVASAVLGLAAVEPAWGAHASAFAMGALNAALGKIGTEGVGLTYVTGALVKFGQGIGHWLAGTHPGFAWLMQAAMWVSILLGACLMTIAMQLHAISGPWPLPLLGLVLAFLAYLIDRSRRRSDACPSAPPSNV